MYKIFHPLPNGKSFAFVSRSATSSFALMAMRSFYPDMYEEYLKNPENKNNGTSHRMIPYHLCRNLPHGSAVMVRNPLERFASLIWRTGISPELALDRLYWFFGLGAEPQNIDRKSVEQVSGDALYHFLPISMIIDKNSKLFIFPNISDMARYCGIQTPIEHINISKEKISLNQNIIQRIMIAYKNDFNIYYQLKNY